MPLSPSYSTYPPFDAVEPDALTFGVENFKSIAQASLSARRLTLLAGANSSGKSSLLQAVLLLAQSALESSVVINGDLVRLGEPGDVIRTGTDYVSYSFEFPVEPGESSNEQSCAVLRLKLQNPGRTKALTVTELSLTLNGGQVLDAVATEVPTNLSVAQGQTALRIVSQEASLPESYILVSGLTPATLAVLIPHEEVVQYVADMVREQGRGRQPVIQTVLATVPADNPLRSNLASLLNRFRRGDVVEGDDAGLATVIGIIAGIVAPGDWLLEPLSPVGISSSLGRFGSGGMLPPRLQLLSSELASGIFRAVRFAESIVYLGPLRDEPRFAYPLGHTVSALPVGDKGEFTAAYLLDNAQRWISYVGPDGSKKAGYLPTAVKMWCRHLDIAEDVSVKPMGKLGHQLGLSLGGTERDPTAVGVGASQLLPVVVLVLGAPSGSTVLLEQPELHLHPKVQSKLGDFLIRSRPDLRLVVETHSEYLLTRLRLRLAEGVIPSDAVSVLFASQQPSHETSELYTDFEALKPDALGDFNRWPDNFFDSLDKEGVALAKAVNDRLRETDPPAEI